ncbi:MAG: hypothetical protein AB9869_04820 [Verrucomicrobiia bacterium]
MVRMTRVGFGRGRTNGSFNPVFDHNEVDHYPFAVWTYGAAEIHFCWLSNKPPFDSEDKRRELLNRLNQVPGIRLPEAAITRCPGIPLPVFSMPESLEILLKAFNWFIGEIQGV